MFDFDAARVRSPDDIRRALVADDDEGQRGALVRHLSGRGFAVLEVRDGYEALSVIGAVEPALAVLRRRIVSDDIDHAVGLATMLYPRTRIILTANDPELVPADSPFTVLPRPVDLDRLDACLAAFDRVA